jgi:hypothetical protein
MHLPPGTSDPTRQQSLSLSTNFPTFIEPECSPLYPQETASSDGCSDCSSLDCINIQYCRLVPNFRTNMLPPSSWSKWWWVGLDYILTESYPESLRSWRWTQHVPPKHLPSSEISHNVTIQHTLSWLKKFYLWFQFSFSFMTSLQWQH